MTRTLIVTLTADTDTLLESAENRIYDGLRWLHPYVPYEITESPSPPDEPKDASA